MALYLNRVPAVTVEEIVVISILFTVAISIKALERSVFVLSLREFFLKLNRVTFSLLVVFVISLFLSNDIALMLLTPLILRSRSANRETLAVFTAFSANAAAIFPFSNPQNLYIFWKYDLHWIEFIKISSSVSIFFLSVILLFAFALFKDSGPVAHGVGFRFGEKLFTKKELPYVFFFFLAVAVSMKILPPYLLIMAFIYSLFFGFEMLKKVDYTVFALFLLFFAFSDLASEMVMGLLSGEDIFFSAAFLSQIISNVPAAVLLSDLTGEYEKLIWGVTVGGYGVLWASMANLIVYKEAILKGCSKRILLFKFFLYGFVFFLLGLFAYIIAIETASF